jgi:hypothetical protein
MYQAFAAEKKLGAPYFEGAKKKRASCALALETKKSNSPPQSLRWLPQGHVDLSPPTEWSPLEP